MKNKVIYYTKSGNTEKLAKAIGEELSCDVATIDTPLTEYVDVLFLGASIYKFGIDKKVVTYIKELDPSKVGKVAVFCTSGKLETGYEKVSQLLKQKGIQVFEENFYCKGKFLSLNKNRPNEDDLHAVKLFANEIMQKDYCD